jgi:hypothetical protein
VSPATPCLARSSRSPSVSGTPRALARVTRAASRDQAGHVTRIDEAEPVTGGIGPSVPSSLSPTALVLKQAGPPDPFTPEYDILPTSADVAALYRWIKIEDGLKWIMAQFSSIPQNLQPNQLKLARFGLENKYIECKGTVGSFLQRTAMGTSLPVTHATIFVIWPFLSPRNLSLPPSRPAARLARWRRIRARTASRRRPKPAPPLPHHSLVPSPCTARRAGDDGARRRAGAQGSRGGGPCGP